MKIAHLILAHTSPEQLARLIRALEYKDHWIFLHLDKKADLNAFLPLIKAGLHVVFISDRIHVEWGAYSVVDATIRGFRAIADSGVDFDYVNLLSGEDYPLKSPEKVHKFFQDNAGKNFMGFESVFFQWTEAIPRLRKYHLTNYQFPGMYFAQKFLNFVLPYRKMPPGLELMGRSQWMTLTMEVVRYILHFIESRPDVVRFFKLTWAPDEIIFQTILFNSPFRFSLVNDNLRYIDWSEHLPSPKVLVSGDFGSIMASDKLYARKFDPEKSSEILDRIDRLMLESGK